MQILENSKVLFGPSDRQIICVLCCYFFYTYSTVKANFRKQNSAINHILTRVDVCFCDTKNDNLHCSISASQKEEVKCFSLGNVVICIP